jgi:hypothetical protein
MFNFETLSEAVSTPIAPADPMLGIVPQRPQSAITLAKTTAIPMQCGNAGPNPTSVRTTECAECRCALKVWQSLCNVARYRAGW